ncbi:hypothetical protein CVT25_003827, partial [Psilocybe cyanescens]
HLYTPSQNSPSPSRRLVPSGLINQRYPPQDSNPYSFEFCYPHTAYVPIPVPQIRVISSRNLLSFRTPIRTWPTNTSPGALTVTSFNLINKSSTSEESDEEKNGPWTTVQSKSSKRHEAATRRENSVEELRKHAKKRAHGRSPEIDLVIHQAEKSLSKDEKVRIDRRNKKVHRERSVSLGEGTSKNKGKFIDPREWGNANIPEAELSSRAQKDAFKEAKKHAKKLNKNKIISSGQVRPIISESISTAPGIRFDQMANHSRLRTNPLPISARPTAHINPKSFLASALKSVTPSKKKIKNYKKAPTTSSSNSPSSSSSSESSSESNDSSSNSSSDDSSSESSEDLPRKSDKRKRHRKHHKSKPSGGKAFKPSTYDGRAD